MDDETVFGPVIHQLTFGQAIQDELLNDYQVVIVGVDEPMVKQWIENYEIVSTDPDETTDARTLAAKIGMLKAVKDYDLKTGDLVPQPCVWSQAVLRGIDVMLLT